MPQCDGGFQVVSEQRAIIRQALLYKKQWEREARHSKRAGEDGRGDGEGSSIQLTPQQLEHYNTEVSEVIANAKRQKANEEVASKPNNSGNRGNALPPIAPRQNMMKNEDRPKYANTNYLMPAVPASSVAMRSSRSSQPSHHAVSSAGFGDASEAVSQMSSRMKLLEEKLEKEEAMRLKVSEELKEMKRLLLASGQPNSNLVGNGSAAGIRRTANTSGSKRPTASSVSKR